MWWPLRKFDDILLEPRGKPLFEGSGPSIQPMAPVATIQYGWMTFRPAVRYPK